MTNRVMPDVAIGSTFRAVVCDVNVEPVEGSAVMSALRSLWPDLWDLIEYVRADVAKDYR